MSKSAFLTFSLFLHSYMPSFLCFDFGVGANTLITTSGVYKAKDLGWVPHEQESH